MHVGIDVKEKDWTDPVWSMVFKILVNGHIQDLLVPFRRVTSALWEVELQAPYLPYLRIEGHF